MDFRTGSANGGTLLRIGGRGFAENSMSDVESAGNNVFFHSSSQRYECDVEKDGTDETTITCQTRSMPFGTYTVRVEVDGVPVPGADHCRWDTAACSLTVSSSSTPVLESVLPLTSTPGSEMSFYGRIFTNKTQSSQEAASNGNTAAISRVWISGKKCSMYKDTDELYGVDLSYTYSEWGTIRCLHTGNYVSSQNGSFIADGGYGRCKLDPRVMKVSSDYRLYNYQTYAIINSITPTTGSVRGGTLITVHGNYLDDSSIQVKVGGEKCEVIHREDAYFTCETSLEGNFYTDAFPGSRGVFVEVYAGLGDKTEIENIAFEDYTGTKSNFTYDRAEITFTASSAPAVVRLRGFFVPAKDGAYDLLATGDTDFYLSTDHTMSKKVLSPGGVTLSAGNHYYYEAVHTASGASGTFSISAHLEETGYTSSQTAMAKEERQTISTTSPDENEIQKITLNDWVQINSPVNQVLELCISCVENASCGLIEEYKITLDGISTGYLMSYLDASAVKFWIEQLPTLEGDTVQVVKSSDPGTCIAHYVITVQSNRGNISLEADALDPSRVSAELSVTEPSQPSLSSFTLAVDGIPSGHVTVGDTASLERAVKNIFGTSCPSALEAGLGTASFYLDFESTFGTSMYGGWISSEDSYCGSSSLRNPTYIAHKFETPISLNNQLQLCIAHKGSASWTLVFDYQYVTFDSEDIFTSHAFGYTAEVPDDWRHVCFNLFESLEDTSESFAHQVSSISLMSSATDGTFFVDNIFLGQVHLLPDEIDILRGMRRLPLHETLRLENVIVTQNDDDYTVEMVTFNCGIGLPLLEVAYAAKNVSGDYTHDSWNSSSITVVRRQFAAPPIGGTYTLTLPADGTVYGGVLSDIPWNIEAYELESRIEELNGISDVYVSRSGTCRGYHWSVDFIKPAGRQKEFSAFGVFENVDASISTAVERKGGLYLDPIPGDWLRVANKEPDVEVTINNVPSKCDGQCSFTYDDAATPSVSEASVTDNTVSITGIGYSATADDNTVKIGGVACTVTSADETNIECTIGESPAGTQPLVVNVKDKGNTNSVDVQVPFTVGTVTPSSGSHNGGTVVTITGTGFSSDVSVEIGNLPCTILESEYSTITCVTGSSDPNAAEITVTAGTITATLDAGVTYTFETFTATVVSLSTATFTVLGGNLTITGTDFRAESSENMVYIGEESIKIHSWSDTDISVTAPPLAPGTYTLRVYIHPFGNAASSENAEVQYALQIDNVSPTQSSLLGGIDITITGDGFEEEAKVTVGENLCVIKERSTTSITCTIGTCGETHHVVNTGTSVNGDGYAWNPEKLTINAGDQVAWSWSKLDGITGAAYQVFTTRTSSSRAYNQDGFSSGNPSASGSYVYRFNVPGTYYIGGLANSVLGIFMRNVITVQDAADVATNITVEVGDYQVTLADAVSCHVDLTPTITNISSSSGTSESLITVTGTGLLNSDEKTKVFIGNAACTVEETTETYVTCKVDTDTELTVGLFQEVRVNVGGKGDSRSDIQNLADRYFALLPFISSVTPSTGSIKGKTTITITGGGLSHATEVLIQGIACSIVSKSYTEVQCETGESVAGTYSVDVAVFENSIPMDASCSGVCTFEYRTEDTPTLTLVDPTTVSGTTTITIAGEGLQVDETSAVLIGSTRCTDLETTDNGISCSVSDLPVGDHIVQVIVGGKGAADSGNNTFLIASIAEIFTVSSSSGSAEGGAEITVTGNGFVSGETSLTIGGVAVALVVAPSSIVFTSPAMSDGVEEIAITCLGVGYDAQTYNYSEADTPVVTSISPSSGEEGDTITLSATLTSDSIEPSVLFGGVNCEFVSVAHGNIECKLGARYGGNADIVVVIQPFGLARVGAGVSFSYDFSVTSVNPPAGSLGGGQEITVTGSGMSPNATIMICDKECEHTLTERTATSITCLTPPSTQDEACNVAVMNSDSDIITLDAAYSYDLSLTPIVTSVNPTSGGTGGGTNLTIEGSNLEGATEVTIDSTECVIHSNTGTKIVCRTGQHSGTIQTKVKVHSGTNGIAATDNADFHYIDKWSSVFTWGGESLPQEGDFVVIQKGQTVLFDTTSAKLSMLLIKGGSLIFEERENEEVHLNADNILIVEGGLLQIGTEDEPYMTRARITMHGHLRSKELPIYGTKTLGVRDGKLELHGKHVDTTWTLLDQTANAGDSNITLQIPVTWSAGDQIVIASTGLRHSQKENEDRIIEAISADGRVLTLNQPLTYRHLGFTEQYTNENGETFSFDYRGEVGLLSRNIVFEGSDDTAWHDNIAACPDGFHTGMFATQTCFQGRFGEEVGNDQFGASIMIHSPTPTTDPDNPVAEAHIEYVELTYVGQAFRLGRYPIHWHLMGDMRNSYVRGCAFHKSFNRAVSIHGTHNLLVERNVIYNIMGGAFFIEDGIETGNIIQYNLAIFVIQSTSLLNDDITPAAYWITNPNNTIQHNHAAGGTHFGFWYRMHQHPDGPSFDSSICQQKVELGIFQNNTVHSQGWYGLWIFQTYTPMEGGGCGSNTPMAAKFYSLTVWHCQKGAEWVKGGAIQFHDFRIAGTESCGIDAQFVIGTGYDKEDRGALLKNNVIIGSKNTMNYGHSTPTGICMPATPGLWIDGVDFFNVGSALSIGGCNQCGGFYHLVENMKFSNTPVRIGWKNEHHGVIYDLDGSFSGTGESGTKVVPHSKLYDDENGDCVKNTDAMFGGVIPACICKPHVRFHRLSFNNVQPGSLQEKDVTVTNAYGNSTSQYMKKRLTHKFGWMFLLLGHQTYDMEFAYGEEYFTNISFSSVFYDFLDEDYVIMRQTLYRKPDGISLFTGDSGRVGNTTEVTSSSANREWHYDENTGEFTYIVGRPSSSSRKPATVTTYQASSFGVNLNIYRCLFLNCIPRISNGTLEELNEIPDISKTYTATDLFAGNHCMEITGDTGDHMIVYIPGDCSIIWGIPEATMHMLYIRGNLFFDQNVAITISAVNIINEGRLIAGWSHDDPHQNNINIILRGNKTMDSYVTDIGVRVAPKVLACFGTCELHGKLIATAWTRLEQTADAGSQTLVLREESSWNVGDEIVIAPSGFNAWQTEKNIITDVTGNTLTLKNTLEFTHTAEIKNWCREGKCREIDLSAEVGLLTRSIVIKSEETDDLLDESFGASVLVATKMAYTASGRFSNVEFYHSGQDESLSFSVASRNAEVIDCSFHDGFSAAIRVSGTDFIMIRNNVIHHTVDSGLVIAGTGHTLESNLIVLNIFPGSYQDKFKPSPLYNAAVNVEGTRILKMTSNVVAGAERVGYRIAGQPCGTDTEKIWSENVAKATLMGVMQMATVGDCSLTSGFHIYKAWDYGIYQQTSDSTRVENCTIIDCTVGYAAIIVGPGALSHAASNKYARISNSFLSARSDTADCTVDMNEATDDSLIIRRIAGASKKALTSPGGGRTGIVLPLFASYYNGAPFKGFLANKNYPALYGQLEVIDVTAAYFGDACGVTDRFFYTNPKNEDAVHPTYVKGLRTQDFSEQSYVFIDRPSTGLINPADCVDMSCDGKRKVLIRVEDDDILGDAYIFPESDYQWDGRTVYGLGDYRIPKAMLTTPDGQRIFADTLAPNGRGIARTDDCELKSYYQAYVCSGSNTHDYRMLVIESLDGDTESRRLSPVALLSDGYVDLYNGPQDHGWCSGYTCQKRISVFYTVVPLNMHTDIFFTSTPPKNFRLHLINGNPEDKITVGIWIPSPMKLDVHDASGAYVLPLNAGTNNGQTILLKPPATNPDQYSPTPTSSNGDNFLDFDTRMLYITVGSKVTIHTKNTIIVNFGFPEITISQFFGKNIVENIANLLGIPSEKIRRVNVVAETSTSRRKRNADIVYFMVQIESDTPEDANEIGNSLRTSFQLGTLVIGGVQPESMQSSVALDDAELVRQDEALANDDDIQNLRTVAIPRTIVLVTTPAFEETVAVDNADKLTVHLLDDNEEVVVTDNTWTVKIELVKTHANADSSATLSGTQTSAFDEGVAQFTDLMISHSGTYSLTFTPLGSASALLPITSEPFVVNERTVNAQIERLQNSGPPTEGDELKFDLKLVDGSNNDLQDITFKGLAYKIKVSFDDSSIYGTASLSGNTIFEFDSTTGQLSMTGLSLIGTTDYHIYNLNFDLFTEPASNYNFSVGIQQIQIYPKNETDYIHHNTSNRVEIVLRFSSEYDQVVSLGAQETIETAFYNDLSSQYTDVYFSPLAMSETFGRKLQFTTSATATTMFAIEAFIEEFSDAGTLRYGTTSITLDSSCGFSVDGDCYGETTTTVVFTTSDTTTSTASRIVIDDNMTSVIIFSVLGSCVVVALLILVVTYALKRYQGSKVGPLRCVDASPMSSPTPSDSMDDIQPYAWGRGSPDSQERFCTTKATAP